MKRVKSYNYVFDYNKFRNDVDVFVNVHDLNHGELDELAGVGKGVTSRILSSMSQNHKMDTWLAIANAMDIDVRTYFVLDV